MRVTSTTYITWRTLAKLLKIVHSGVLLGGAKKKQMECPERPEPSRLGLGRSVSRYGSDHQNKSTTKLYISTNHYKPPSSSSSTIHHGQEVSTYIESYYIYKVSLSFAIIYSGWLTIYSAFQQVQRPAVLSTGRSLAREFVIGGHLCKDEVVTLLQPIDP